MMRQRLVQVLRSADDAPDMDTVVRRFWSPALAPRPHRLGRDDGDTRDETRTARVLDLVPRLEARAAREPRG
jgi:hypothetical protein